MNIKLNSLYHIAFCFFEKPTKPLINHWPFTQNHEGRASLIKQTKLIKIASNKQTLLGFYGISLIDWIITFNLGLGKMWLFFWLQ